MKLRRPHVVPRGYQRLFADGERLMVIDKTTGEQRLQGTRQTFVQNGFLTYKDRAGNASDSAEDAFEKIETAVFPIIHTVRYGAPITERQRTAVVGLTAMLFARSFAADLVRQRIETEVLDDQTPRLVASRSIRHRFRQDYGREPRPGELDELIRRFWAERSARRIDALTAMVRHHNHAVEILESRHCAFLWAGHGSQFVTSDNPVILAGDPGLLHLGVHRGVGLATSELVIVPLARGVIAVFTRDRDIRDGVLSRWQARHFNNATWRNAVRYVGCHPDADWAQLCGVTRP